MADLPLSGVRVVELARVLAGPWAGQLLSDLGADVIKVESPEGDDTRAWGPPFVKGKDGQNLSSAYYHSTNRGKRSITVDFSSEEGASSIRELARTSQVLIENFKVGGLKKYGLDYKSLSRINPALVYCSITGFGQNGPYAGRAGYDFIIQGMSGMMSITGERGGEPQKAGVAIADLFTGLYSVVAIQAALRHAERTGRGQHIDMSLLDCQVAALANQNMNYLISGVAPPQMGNAQVNIAPYEVMRVKDGNVIIAVGNDRQFQRYCKAIGLPDLASDPDFATNSARVHNRESLRRHLFPRMADMERDVLLARLEADGVPAGPINSIEQMFGDEQIRHRGMKLELTDDLGNTLPTVRSPIVFSETPLDYSAPSPRLGQHNQEILGGMEGDAGKA